jgi:hypothetical protein
MSAAAMLAAACFWQVPVDLPLPETNVVYLRGDVDLQAGERLRLDGEFPHARQLGINVHARPSNATLASVADTALPALPGHSNPFAQGARRDGRERRWALEIAPTEPVGLRDGRLGLGATHETPFRGRILLRIYLPDRAHPGGGVPMPHVHKLSAMGQWERLGGDCPSTADLPKPQLPGPTRLPAAPGDFADPLDWRGSATPAGTAQADLLVNRDNAYAYAMIDLARGDVLMLEGRAPRFPRTREGAETMGNGDVRYWSICAYVHPSNRTAACLADEDIPIDRMRRFRIVVAPAERRPTNAQASCGIAFLPAPGPGEGVLILRHVAPEPHFRNTPLHVAAGADASAALGAYEPVGRYRSIREVEDLGCHRKTSR